MNSSPATTGAIGAVTGTVLTVVAALVKHYNLDISADAQVSIAIGVVTAAHWLGQQLAARAAAKQAPKTPAVQQ
jgi:hypothetical protein